MLKIAYSGRSRPTAEKFIEISDEIELIRRSSPEVDVNWGRDTANSALNPDISNATNKRVMRELFEEHDVPMPPLMGFNELVEAYRAGETIQVIGRPDKHTKGRGLWRIHDLKSLFLARKGTDRKRAATHFMEFVESDREYRVHIFKGKSIRISEKEFNEDGTYTTKKPGDIKLRKVREAAKAAVSAVGLDFGAVDILASGADNDKVFVLEVNSAPGLGGSMPQLYLDTFKKWKNNEWGDADE